ncbi:hypothetical protein P175DRAFT_0261600 [Aspergillus ochraceoroseus IBT 24754]|uniref:Uncharacterized protein n=1 Tax=Aspergillus ochraceoroseus IBT 24754 TaxID=1392256 RepID=A0A2T5LUK4_9EURO|nr:uncharacterized protein P175DRAFT_0261600 [Aspergillus ochraceoroseus IBT 24754]PTU19965.1 hypothetical protein P175DRAFT_0261600 [Aspergillus ochraceoroseus IBT 24754]
MRLPSYRFPSSSLLPGWGGIRCMFLHSFFCDYRMLISYKVCPLEVSNTYDHRKWKIGLPVRSAVLKPLAGQLVVWWVTTCES